MKILKQDNITCSDVDNTLVLWSKDFKTPGPGKLEFKYGDETVYLKPHTFHPTFIKHCYLRGDYIIVWSQNGWSWAQQVVDKLGLNDYVDVICSKPTRHIDDKEDLADIVGNRIFIKD